MSRKTPLRRVAGPLMLAMFASGCSSTLQHSIEQVMPQKAEYRSANSLPPLEVPPDLSSATLNDSMPVPEVNGTTYSDYSAEARAHKVAARDPNAVLPKPSGVRMQRSGDERWLVFQAPPEEVWPGVREFLLQMGFTLKEEDPTIGILETDWAEHRADLPKDALRSFLGKLIPSFGGARTREKFRIRLERGTAPGTTWLYVSHRGAAVETVQGKDGEYLGWKPRPSDPEVEAEMLARIMMHFGVTEERANRMMARTPEQRERARMVREGDGSAALAVMEEFPLAWRRTGVALDRVGFTVEDWDRSQGVYYVRYDDPEQLAEEDDGGWLSKLKFWGDDQSAPDNSYLISLVEDGDDTTQVVVLNKNGERANGATADRILSLLHEQLR